MTNERDIYEPVYEVVRRVPAGKVVTYGQVADYAVGVALTARQVGAAMFVAPKDVPWQRVVGAGGHLPVGKRSPEHALRQRRLLEEEGVLFLSTTDHRVDMARCQWACDEDPAAQGSLF